MKKIIAVREQDDDINPSGTSTASGTINLNGIEGENGIEDESDFREDRELPVSPFYPIDDPCEARRLVSPDSPGIDSPDHLRKQIPVFTRLFGPTISEQCFQLPPDYTCRILTKVTLTRLFPEKTYGNLADRIITGNTWFHDLRLNAPNGRFELNVADFFLTHSRRDKNIYPKTKPFPEICVELNPPSSKPMEKFVFRSMSNQEYDDGLPLCLGEIFNTCQSLGKPAGNISAFDQWSRSGQTFLLCRGKKIMGQVLVWINDKEDTLCFCSFEKTTDVNTETAYAMLTLLAIAFLENLEMIARFPHLLQVNIGLGGRTLANIGYDRFLQKGSTYYKALGIIRDPTKTSKPEHYKHISDLLGMQLNTDPQSIQTREKETYNLLPEERKDSYCNAVLCRKDTLENIKMALHKRRVSLADFISIYNHRIRVMQTHKLFIHIQQCLKSLFDRFGIKYIEFPQNTSAGKLPLRRASVEYALRVLDETVCYNKEEEGEKKEGSLSHMSSDISAPPIIFCSLNFGLRKVTIKITPHKDTKITFLVTHLLETYHKYLNCFAMSKTDALLRAASVDSQSDKYCALLKEVGMVDVPPPPTTSSTKKPAAPQSKGQSNYRNHKLSEMIQDALPSEMTIAFRTRLITSTKESLALLTRSVDEMFDTPLGAENHLPRSVSLPKMNSSSPVPRNCSSLPNFYPHSTIKKECPMLWKPESEGYVEEGGVSDDHLCDSFD